MAKIRTLLILQNVGANATKPHKNKTNNYMKEQLKQNGFVHLKNQSETQLQKILNSIGLTIMTTDIVVKSASKGLVTTDLEIDFHTDHYNAKYIVWYCHKQTDEGGDSLLIDAENLYLQLSIEEQENLKKVQLFEHKIFPEDKTSYPFVVIDDKNNKKFHCSLMDDFDKNNPAFIAFQNLVKETKPTRINLKEKDVLIVNNHRIFHGRTAIKGNKDRFLKRYWLSSINNNY